MKVLPISEPIQYASDLFSLQVSGTKLTTTIEMHAFSGLYTSDYPDSFKILKTELPSVLKSRCFNDAKKPFFEEVKDTEIAHLFEHILLEFLCIEKMASGAKNADFSGWTEWNWDTDDRGTFHITIDCGETDFSLLPKALEKTIALVSAILQSERKAPSQYANMVIGGTPKLTT